MCKQLFYKILGTLITIFILYRLFILDRISYKIDYTISFRVILVVVGVVILNVIIIYKLFREILLFDNSMNKLTSFMLTHFYHNPLTFLGQYLLKYPLSIKGIIFYSSILELVLDTKSKIGLFISIYILYPRIFLAIVLTFDVFILEKMLLCFKFIPIIAMSLGTQTLIYLSKSYAIIKLDYIQKSYAIIHVSDNPVTFSVRSLQDYTSYDKEAIIDDYIFYTNIISITSVISEMRKTFYYRGILLLISLITFSAWIKYLCLFWQSTSSKIMNDPYFIQCFIRLLLGI